MLDVVEGVEGFVKLGQIFREVAGRRGDGGRRDVGELGAGGAWFEAGPDPVLAMASASEITGFARVMILPRSCHGKSSIRYVRPEDADKPKSQTYQIFADEFITP